MRPICRRPWCTQDRWAKSGSKKIEIGRNICSIREYHRPCSGLTAWTAMVDARFGHWPILSALKVLKGSAEMKHALASLTIGACLLLPSASVVFAAGQPGASCLSAGATMTPGSAAASPGSPFNESGTLTPAGGTAGQVYAGNRQGAPTTASPNAVSQYDVACLQVTTHATTHQPP